MKYAFLQQLNNAIMITGTGHATGADRWDNQALLDHHHIRLKASFIDKSIGIEQRYFLSDEQATSDIAAQAAQIALDNAGITIDVVDRLVLATSSPDYQTPASACIVQHKLGGKGFPAMDINAACSGFIYALDYGARCLATGDETILIIGADARSTDIDFHDKRTAFLYGDGAGAVVLQAKPRAMNSPINNDSSLGLINSVTYADGIGYDAVYKPVGGSQTPVTEALVADRQHKLHMPDGRRVANNALEGFSKLTQDIFVGTPYTLDNVDAFIFHQPNRRLLEGVIQQLNIPAEKAPINFQNYGNTVAGSIPLALSDAHQHKKIPFGSLVLLCGVGGGFTGGAHLLRWHL